MRTCEILGSAADGSLRITIPWMTAPALRSVSRSVSVTGFSCA
jgi:hypothetical protein